MNALPKIVRERLKAGAGVGEHPDPNLLTEFAEQSLGGHERERVLEHISRCQECRQVLAVALPPLEAARAAPARQGSSPAWLRWPALRWGAVAACFVVVGAAVLLRQNAKHMAPVMQVQQAIEAREERSAPAAAEVPEPAKALPATKTPAPRAPAAPSAVPKPPALQAKSLPAKQLAEARGAQVAGIASGGGGGVAVRIPPSQAQAPANERDLRSNLILNSPASGANPARGALDQAVSVPAQSEAVEVKSGAAPAPAPPATASQEMLRRQVLGKAKASPVAAPAPTPASAENTLKSAQAANLALVGRNVAPGTVRWSISADGQLQRSFDSGKTWETVAVAENSSLAQVSAEPTSDSPSSRYTRDALAEKKELAPRSGAVKMHALSANGSDVWVGGEAGTLYHSVDAGMHWTRVKPVSGGVMLSADIVALDFADAQHGKLTTSSGESWSTSDAGTTWQKR